MDDSVGYAKVFCFTTGQYGYVLEWLGDLAKVRWGFADGQEFTSLVDTEELKLVA